MQKEVAQNPRKLVRAIVATPSMHYIRTQSFIKSVTVVKEDNTVLD
jgi:hypothetical protein